MSEGINIGIFTIRWYGLIIMAGALAAAYLSDQRAKQQGRNNEFIWDALPWVLIGGIVGARIWHVLFPAAADGVTREFYFTHPLDALAVWNGGLGIPGGVIGGALAMYFYARKRGESFLVWADIIAPGLVLAQGIGRWGNFVNQELYGPPTDLPWKIFIAPEHRNPELMQFEYYHPLFLYEFLWNLLVMGALLWISRKFADWLKPGDVFLFYLIGYPVGRFMLEFLRLDIATVGSLNINQFFMGAIALTAASLLIIRHRPGKVQQELQQ